MGFGERASSAFTRTNGTNMPPKSTENILENVMNGTSEQLELTQSKNTTLSVRDFLAKVSLLLGKGKDSMIQGVRYFTRYAESLGFTQHHIYSLRTSKDSSITITDRPSASSSNRWMNWGMTASGKCLTAKTSESPKTGKECSLSEILEERVDRKYFLSERLARELLDKSTTQSIAQIGYSINEVLRGQSEVRRVEKEQKQGCI